MIYLFSSKPQTIAQYFRSSSREYTLVDKDLFNGFLATYNPKPGDLGIVYDFGKIIPEKLLQNLFMVNVHFSLLPKYRGATPVEAAILAKETVTGITIQKMVKAMDAGDIVVTKEVRIDPIWSSGQLQQYMDSLLPDMLDRLLSQPVEKWKFVPQVGEGSICYKVLLNREKAELNFATMDSDEIFARVKAFNPEPYGWIQIKHNTQIKAMNILRVELDPITVLKPKELVFVKKKGVIIGCKLGSVLVTELVIAGSKPLSGGDIVALKGSISLV